MGLDLYWERCSWCYMGSTGMDNHRGTFQTDWKKEVNMSISSHPQITHMGGKKSLSSSLSIFNYICILDHYMIIISTIKPIVCFQVSTQCSAVIA